MASDITRIIAKAKAAGVRLNAPAGEVEVAAFEKERGATLPIGYRDFLITAGNGGSGPPSHGISPLGLLPSDYDLQAPDLRKQFPFTQPWIWEDGGKSREGTIEDVNCGAIILGTDGCAQYWMLIANGPEKGKIWMRAGVGIAPLKPSMTFLEWYEAWLDGRRDWWN